MKWLTYAGHCLIFLISLSSYSLAVANTHSDKEVDWVQSLQLSIEQQQQIKDIENVYRVKHKNLKSQECTSEEKRTQLTAQLKKQMHQDIHNILTAEQKQQASAVIQTQHRSMQLRHAREIAHQLKMDNAQKKEFLNAIDNIQYNYQWPLNVRQREIARTLFTQVLEQHLNASQHQQWQELLNKQANKWHRFDEFQSKCFATDEDV